MSFEFVEEGKWTRDAESLKLKVCIVFYLMKFFLTILYSWPLQRSHLCLFFNLSFSINLVKQKQEN